MTQSCMGGRCSVRELCRRYQAASVDHQPQERVCPVGEDGASLQPFERELIDMTRIRFSTEARVEQAFQVLRPEGVGRKEIAQTLGIKTAARICEILSAAVKEGRIFPALARISTTMKTPETVYFPTAESRDAFMVKYRADKEERRRAMWREKSFSRRGRDRSAEIAARSAQRAATRAQRQAEADARAAQRRALRVAEFEMEQERRRLNAEAKSAAKQRKAAESEKTRERLKMETKAAGQLALPKGTASPAAVKPRGPAHLAGELDLSHAKITIAPPPVDRWACKPQGYFSSAKPGTYPQPASTWAEAVTA